jgi:hypothetical protein
MHFLPKLALQTAAACVLLQSANASIVLNFGGDRFDDRFGNPVVAGTLFQLVNLGSDGVFNDISLIDGTLTGADRFVSGDDKVLDFAFTVGVLAGDFASAAAFDLSYSASTETAGILDRTLTFGKDIVLEGTKLGIRWFPGLSAAQYYSGGVDILQGGQFYGQFTRQASPIVSNLWISPRDGSNYTFDPLVTADGGSGPFPGADLATAGDAVKEVIVPEPAAIGLSLIGAAGIALLRRRRA